LRFWQHRLSGGGKGEAPSTTAGRISPLHRDTFSDFVGRKSGDANHFCAAGLAGSNGNGRSRYLQKFREEFDAGFIGSAFDWG
jgi:hypothetical protein